MGGCGRDGAAPVSRLVQVLGVALGMCLVVKVLAWAVTPVLPFIAGLFALALVGFVVSPRRRL